MIGLKFMSYEVAMKLPWERILMGDGYVFL